MLPISLLQIAPFIAALRIVVADLPNGDIERTLLTDAQDGVNARVERKPLRSDVRTYREFHIPRGKYSWRIVEERRSVLMTAPGRPTGVIRRAYGVILFSDRRDPRSVTPNPVEAFRFYTSTREAAEALQERLRKSLSL